MLTERLTLLAVLGLAAFLRFSHLDWGLQHQPHHDERVFVEAVAKMAVRHDLDQRFYEYPGLFIYLLYAVLAPLGIAHPPGASTYLVARGVVAGFGVASVALAWALGRRLGGAGTGLCAALLLAVAPPEVETAHMIRPDVVLEAFVLAALIAFLFVGERWRDDLRAGAALGAAASVKFTGGLLVLSYLLARALAPGRRLRGAALGLLAAGAVWFATTPYAALEPERFLAGAGRQWSYVYESGTRAAPGEVALYYARKLSGGLGPLGSVAALLGLAAAWPRGRRWAPALAYAVALPAVLSTAPVRFERLALSSLGILCVLAGRGLDELARRLPRRAWGVPVAVLAAALPCAESAAYLGAISQPSPLDEAVAWADRLPRGTRVLSLLPEAGLDRRRLEVLDGPTAPAQQRLLALHADYTLSTRPLGEGLRPVYVAEPRNEWLGPAIAAYAVAEAARPRYEDLPLDRARARASSNDRVFAELVAGRAPGPWRSAAPQTAADWIELELERPEALGRIELLDEPPGRGYGRALRVFVSENGKDWRPVAAEAARARPREQVRARRGRTSQVLVFEPVRVRWIRVQPGAPARQPWVVAGLALGARVAP